ARAAHDIHACAARAVSAAMDVLMKFSESLLRMPGDSRVAPSQLSTSDPTVAATTMTKSVAPPGTIPSAPATVARASAPTIPAAVPSSDTAPDVPGATRCHVVTAYVRRPHALPISLAIVSLPPATSAAANARRAASGDGPATASIDAT